MKIEFNIQDYRLPTDKLVEWLNFIGRCEKVYLDNWSWINLPIDSSNITLHIEGPNEN